MPVFDYILNGLLRRFVPKAQLGGGESYYHYLDSATGRQFGICRVPLAQRTIFIVREFPAHLNLFKFGLPAWYNEQAYGSMEEAAAAIHQALVEGKPYLRKAERRTLPEQIARAKQELRKAEREMGWFKYGTGVLAGCHNQFGLPLAEDINGALLRYLNGPLPELWQAIHSYHIVGKETAWDIWKRFDPEAQTRRAPGEPWKQIPDAATLSYAIQSEVLAQTGHLEARIEKLRSAIQALQEEIDLTDALRRLIKAVDQASAQR